MTIEILEIGQNFEYIFSTAAYPPSFDLLAWHQPAVLMKHQFFHLVIGALYEFKLRVDNLEKKKILFLRKEFRLALACGPAYKAPIFKRDRYDKIWPQLIFSDILL